MTTKKKNNLSFTLTVIFMISLILALTLPTAIAWFTAEKTKSSTTQMNFGSVAIGTSDTITLTNTNSSIRNINYILPGDIINLSFEVYNAGSVDSYAKIYYDVKVLYNDTDITPLLFDDTDPVTQPYLRVSDISSVITPTFYENGSELNQIFVLDETETIGNGKIVTGVLEFARTLPNSVTDGTNTYVLNGAPQGTKLQLQIDIQMATIQKDNTTIDNATTELSTLIQELMPIEYTLGFVNGTPTLMVGTTPIQTTSYYNVTSSSSDSEAYAFVAELDGEKTLLAVVGEGSMNDYSSSTQPWKDARTNITETEVEDGITNIGNYAFYSCSNLTSVKLPESVTTIGSYAFQQCKSLTTIELPSNLTSIGPGSFGYCTNLSSINIPDSVTSIGYSSFANCPNLTNISIPNNVTSIGSSTFANCTGLTNISIPNNVTSIDSSAFANCTGLTEIFIPKSVTTLEPSFISGASNIKKIVVEEGNPTYHSVNNNFIIENATNKFFRGCSTSVIPNNVSIIGKSAFSGNTNNNQIIIPENITTIEDWAFGNNSGLVTMVVPNSVTSMGQSVFSGCSSLTSVTLSDYITTLNSSTFYSCKQLSTIHLPSNLKTIGSQVFRSCSALKTIDLPNTLTNISSGSFEDSGLTSVTLPESMTTVQGFYGAYNLEVVIIPSTATSISSSAFCDCYSLKTIIIPKNIKKISSSIFTRCNKLTVYMEHSDSSELTLTNGWNSNRPVYYYSETAQSGYWHYDSDGVTPVLW